MCRNRPHSRSDRRQAVTEMRHQIWLPLAFSGFFSILSVVLTPETDSLLMRCLGGITVFAGLFSLMTGGWPLLFQRGLTIF